MQALGAAFVTPPHDDGELLQVLADDIASRLTTRRGGVDIAHHILVSRGDIYANLTYRRGSLVRAHFRRTYGTWECARQRCFYHFTGVDARPLRVCEQVYLDACLGDDNLRVLLFRTHAGAAAPPVLLAQSDDDDTSGAVQKAEHTVAVTQRDHVRVLGGDATSAVQNAAAEALRKLPEGEDAAVCAASLRLIFGEHERAATLVAHATTPLGSALAAQRGSMVRLAWRDSHFLLWRAARPQPREVALLRYIASPRNARIAAMALAAAAALAYHAMCRPVGTSGVCAALRQVVSPLVALFLALSALDSPLARRVRAACAPTRRPHVD